MDLSGRGKVWSFAVYHRAMHPDFADSIPYTVAMVELDEGVRMVGTMVEPTPELRIGQAVSAVFEPATPEVTLVRWTPSQEV